MALNCGGKLGVIFLVVLNTIFALLGLALLIGGILFKTNATFITDGIKPALSLIVVGNFDLYTLAVNASNVILAVGVITFVVAALGCAGACCKVRVLLVIYAIVVLIVVIIEIAGVVLWFVYKEQSTDFVKTQFKTALDANYKGNNDTSNAASQGFNVMFKQLECCGINNIEAPANTAATNDFVTTVNWWVDGSRGADLIPKWCCVDATAQTITDNTFTDTTCYQGLTNYYTTGCFNKVVDTLTTYSTYFIGVGITVLVLEILAVVFAFCICKQSGGDDDLKGGARA